MIRQALDQGLTSIKMINDLKLPPFIIQKGISQVGNFSLEKLRIIIGKIVKADFLVKTGRADAKILLDLIIVGS